MQAYISFGYDTRGVIYVYICMCFVPGKVSAAVMRNGVNDRSRLSDIRIVI